MTRYRKRPVEVEAHQLTGSTTDIHDVYLWIEENIGSVQPPSGDDWSESPGQSVTIDPADGMIVIRTLEGDMKAQLGDWIIRGVAGEFYPCRDSIFRETYEPAAHDEPGRRPAVPDVIRVERNRNTGRILLDGAELPWAVDRNGVHIRVDSDEMPTVTVTFLAWHVEVANSYAGGLVPEVSAP